MPQKDVGYLIKNINDRLKVKADADLKHNKLTLAQSRVLAFLDSRGGQATQKEIEVYLEVSHPTVVGIFLRMEQNGHLECWLDETDKRNKIVALTQQAKSLGVIHGFPIGIQLIKLTTDKPTSKKIIIVSGSPITDAIFEYNFQEFIASKI